MDLIATVAPASPSAEDARTAYIVMLALGAAIAIAVNAALVVAAIRFRASRGREPLQLHGSKRVQRTAAGVAAAVAVFSYVAGVVFTERAGEVPSSGSEVHVRASGQQWLWRYEYLDEGEQGSSLFSYHELVVPVGATVMLDVESTDAIHGWQVPALSGGAWAVPGARNKARFVAETKGVYEGRSTVYSGSAYPAMRTRVRVVDPVEYKRWLRVQRRAIEAGQVAVRTALEAQTAGSGGTGASS